MDASEDLSTAVLAELPSEVAVLDETGTIVYTNRAWRRFAEENGLGGDPASLGQDYLDVCDANADSESARDAAAGIRSLLAGDAEEFSMEYPCHSPDERRYFSMRAKRFDHAGDDYVLLVHADVTDRRTAEERVRAQNDRLERVAAVLSHDLRNPLNVAKGYVGMLSSERADGEGDADRTEHLTRVQSALDRMSAILDDALLLARPRDVGETETVNLRTAAERAWANVRSGDATLDVTDTVAFEADASLLDSLFENLFRNSVEHGSTSSRKADDSAEYGSTGSRGEPDSGVEHGDTGPAVRVGTLDGDGGFYVEDDGPGLPPERREKAFEAGFTTSDGRGNTGLGLAIVESVADAHGWRVDATEGTDGGARFEVRV